MEQQEGQADKPMTTAEKGIQPLQTATVFTKPPNSGGEVN